jgi:hypothetical protein
VITLTALRLRKGHALPKEPFMPASKWQLNRFERVLFSVAVVLGSVLVAVRIGAIVALWFVHHR